MRTLNSLTQEEQTNLLVFTRRAVDAMLDYRQAVQQCEAILGEKCNSYTLGVLQAVILKARQQMNENAPSQEEPHHANL